MEKIEKVYVINGWTSNIGQWELEGSTSPAVIMERFNEYADEYSATPDYSEDGVTAFADCDEGSFWIEEVDLLETENAEG